MNATTQQHASARREFLALALLASTALLVADRAHSAELMWKPLTPVQPSAGVVGAIVEVQMYGRPVNAAAAITTAECARGWGVLSTKAIGSKSSDSVPVSFQGQMIADSIFRWLCGRQP